MQPALTTQSSVGSSAPDRLKQVYIKIYVMKVVKSRYEESLLKEFLLDSYLGVDSELPYVDVLALGHVAGLLVRCQNG